MHERYWEWEARVYYQFDGSVPMIASSLRWQHDDKWSHWLFFNSEPMRNWNDYWIVITISTFMMCHGQCQRSTPDTKHLSNTFIIWCKCAYRTCNASSTRIPSIHPPGAMTKGKWLGKTELRGVNWMFHVLSQSNNNIRLCCYFYFCFAEA